MTSPSDWLHSLPFAIVPCIAPHLPRFDPRERSRAQATVDKAVDEASDERTYIAGAGGDGRRLRGIPVVGRGVGGTSPGTNPLAALDNVMRRNA